MKRVTDADIKKEVKRRTAITKKLLKKYTEVDVLELGAWGFWGGCLWMRDEMNKCNKKKLWKKNLKKS